MPENKSFRPESESTRVESMEVSEEQVTDFLETMQKYAVVDTKISTEPKNYAPEMIELMQVAMISDYEGQKVEKITDPAAMRELAKKFLAASQNSASIEINLSKGLAYKHRNLGEDALTPNGKLTTVTERNWRFVDQSERGRFANARDLLLLARTEAELRHAGMKDAQDAAMNPSQIKAHKEYTALRERINSSERTPKWINLKAEIAPKNEAAKSSEIKKDLETPPLDPDVLNIVNDLETASLVARNIIEQGKVVSEQGDPEKPHAGKTTIVEYNNSQFVITRGPGSEENHPLVITELDKTGKTKRHFVFGKNRGLRLK